ncbi:MAG: hypothetical protein WAT92_23760 [Saprospiraceae bacterium]
MLGLKMGTSYMINRCIILIVFLISCKSDSLTSYENVLYFEDFDFFKIEGVKELNSKDWTYPYVRVENLDTMIRLQFYLSEKEIAYDYLHKRKNYWISRVDSIQELDMQYFITYFYKGKEYLIEYHKEKNNIYLDQYVISTKISDSEIRHENYFFEESKKINLGELPWNIKIDDWIRRSNHSLISKNDILTSSMVTSFKEGEMHTSKSCYKIGNLSINYFNYFSFKSKKIDCK